MVKLLTLSGLLLLLSGCSTVCDSYCKQNYINTITTQEVTKKVLVCPANHRDIRKGKRPTLAIHLLTEADRKDPGKVAQAYKITVKQLQGYAQQVELGFDAYRNMCINAEKDLPNEIK